MLRYALRRLVLIIPTLLIVAAVTFGLAHAAPGGPWDKNPDKPLSAELQASLNRKYGLDKPVHEQFVLYLWNAVRGDFGVSLQFRDRQVSDIIADGFPKSAQLGVQAMLVAVAVAIPLGILSALRQNSVVDYGSLFFTTVGVAVPSFVVAIFAIYLFGVIHPFGFSLPVSGWGGGRLQNLVLPTVLLALPATAFLTRITRYSMLEVIRQDYVRTARAKGLTEQVVIVGHALKNALIPVATVLGPATAGVVTGSFIIETIFGIPGIGRYFVQSINARDYPVIMGVYLLYALVISLANLTVDLVYGFLDPRIKVGK
jgi:oligopeptide transport system permease protein